MRDDPRDAALAELEASETRMRLVVDTALDAVVSMDAAGRVVGWNPQAEAIFGWTRDEVLGRTLAELIVPPSLREAHVNGLARFLATGEGPVLNRRVELTALHRDGREFPVELAIAPMKVHGAWVFSAFARDITERKQAEAELLRALAREQELGDLKSHFVSVVSHEFRTPLEIILSSAEILDRYADRLAPEKRRGHLDAIYRAVARMDTLMDEVLVLSKVDAGRMECKPVPLDVAGFCRRVRDEILSATSHRNPIHLEVDGALDDAAADESLCRHVFVNLLSNAVKYSAPGEPVHFSVVVDRPHVIFRVADRGCGIPSADQPRLFQAFHRGRNVGQTPGTGLGLVIVKRCVELHGGRIRCESTEGVGTTFTVRLPLFGGGEA